ncbi:MAG: secretion protein HlyD, partial [Tardiphaga sp.]|nr:secretion protein HlyD [Tardiphaga sp.]
MTLTTEASAVPRATVEKPRPRPVRMGRWFVIVGILLALLVTGIVGFNYIRANAIKNFFATMKPPPTPVTAAEAK